jgi:hypothetical protein
VWHYHINKYKTKLTMYICHPKAVLIKQIPRLELAQISCLDGRITGVHKRSTKLLCGEPTTLHIEHGSLSLEDGQPTHHIEGIQPTHVTHHLAKLCRRVHTTMKVLIASPQFTMQFIKHQT